MKTESLDILQNSQLPAAQSQAILKVMELEMTTAHEQLATKADLADVKAELMRWTLTCMLGQTAVLAGLGYFLLEHFRG